jgi:hypothetical protein
VLEHLCGRRDEEKLGVVLGREQCCVAAWLDRCVGGDSSCDAAVGKGAPALRKLGGCRRDVALFSQETRENELTRWLSSEWLRDREQLVELVGVARHHNDRLPVCRSGSRWAR